MIMVWSQPTVPRENIPTRSVHKHTYTQAHAHTHTNTPCALVTETAQSKIEMYAKNNFQTLGCGTQTFLNKFSMRPKGVRYPWDIFNWSKQKAPSKWKYSYRHEAWSPQYGAILLVRSAIIGHVGKHCPVCGNGGEAPMEAAAQESELSHWMGGVHVEGISRWQSSNDGAPPTDMSIVVLP